MHYNFITPEGIKCNGAQPWVKMARVSRRRSEANALGLLLDKYMALRKGSPAAVRSLWQSLKRTNQAQMLGGIKRLAGRVMNLIRRKPIRRDAA